MQFHSKIYHALKNGLKVTPSIRAGLFNDLAATILDRLDEDKIKERATREKGRLALSSIGHPCPRKVWYEVNKPQSAEEIAPNVKLKFLFGDMIESLVLFLLEAAGCEVTDKQKRVEFNGVSGRIDALVDGYLVDIKSASTLSLKKFKEGINEANDPFGYKMQLTAYAAALGKQEGYFIAVDKQHGHVVIDHHVFTDEDFKAAHNWAEYMKHVVEQDDPPPRAFHDEPDGKSGNRKLGVNCSYCPFKWECWPGLRAFRYSTGPRFLTRVVRQPDVAEIKPIDNTPVDFDGE